MSGTMDGRPVMDIYARLSFAPDGDTINVDDQVEWCCDAVSERGGIVGEVFKDNSLSAWKPTVRRPEWEALMRRLEAGESDGVMVLDLTRFSRKVMEGERLVDLAGRGVRVWSLAGSYDLTSADGRRHFRESMVAAAAESDEISSSGLRRYSTQDPELLGELISDVAWSNEGLFAMAQGLRHLANIGGRRVNLPPIEWELPS